MTTSTRSNKLGGADLDTWRTYLEATRRLFEELDRRLQDEAGISLADYGLLARLAEADEWGMRMGELADSTVFSKSRISHAVSRLEGLGWVERRACPTDRRGSYASLTDQGRDKLGEAQPSHTRVVRQHFLQPLGPSGARDVRDSMAAVRDSLAALTPDSEQ